MTDISRRVGKGGGYSSNPSECGRAAVAYATAPVPERVRLPATPARRWDMNARTPPVIVAGCVWAGASVAVDPQNVEQNTAK